MVEAKSKGHFTPNKRKFKKPTKGKKKTPKRSKRKKYVATYVKSQNILVELVTIKNLVKTTTTTSTRIREGSMMMK